VLRTPGLELVVTHHGRDLEFAAVHHARDWQLAAKPLVAYLASPPLPFGTARCPHFDSLTGTKSEPPGGRRLAAMTGAEEDKDLKVNQKEIIQKLK
jgi:hypothetical protein